MILSKKNENVHYIQFRNSTIRCRPPREILIRARGDMYEVIHSTIPFFFFFYNLPTSRTKCLIKAFISFFLNFLFYIGVWPINNVVTVSGAQQRDSVIRMHVSILPQTPLPSRLPHNIEQSSLCYTVGPCWLSFLNIAVHSTIIHNRKKKLGTTYDNQ